MTEHLCDFAFSVLFVHEQLHYTHVYPYLDFSPKDSTLGKASITLIGLSRFLSVTLSFPGELKLWVCDHFTLSLSLS